MKIEDIEPGTLLTAWYVFLVVLAIITLAVSADGAIP